MRNPILFFSVVKALAMLLLLASISASAQYAHQGINVFYFKDLSVNDGSAAAKVEKKHVLVYLHKKGCDGCVRFADEVMLDSSVKKLLEANFTCVGADIRKGDGNKLAVGMELYKAPALVLMTQEQTLKYAMPLTLDADSIKYRVACWMKLKSIKDQIDLYASTNKISKPDAAKAIGASYARNDFEKTSGGDPKKLARAYTLGNEEVDGFELGYHAKWAELQAKVLTKN